MCRSGCHRRSETNGNAETGGWLSETFQQSSLKIRVFKSGAFSAFVHDHEIQAPIEDGKSDSSATPSVQLRVDSRKMRVLAPEISVDKLAEIQQTMEGTAVLDVVHFPQISYCSTAITKTGDARWEVRSGKNDWTKSTRSGAHRSPGVGRRGCWSEADSDLQNSQRRPDQSISGTRVRSFQCPFPDVTPAMSSIVSRILDGSALPRRTLRVERAAEIHFQRTPAQDAVTAWPRQVSFRFAPTTGRAPC